jgi:hypothetical protein
VQNRIYTDTGAQFQREIGLKGKQVRILHGPATVMVSSLQKATAWHFLLGKWSKKTDKGTITLSSCLFGLICKTLGNIGCRVGRRKER